MGFLSFLFGGRAPLPVPPPQAPPEITAECEEDGFVDLGFAITAAERLADGAVALHAAGVHRGQAVGLTVVLSAAWRAGALGPKVPLVTYTGTVTYRSAGAPSDALMRALDELYGTRLGATALRPETVFTGISLDGEPGDPGKGPVKLKLFYETGGDDGYAELYTNLDLARGILQIHEKDPDYRAPIVRALAGGLG